MIAERIRENLERVKARIAEAAQRSGRPSGSVRLIAVTKRSPAEWIRPLVACGALDLGENYPQELWGKAEALSDLGGDVRWHLIGHLQSNKVRRTLPVVAMIHAVNSLKLLRVLDDAAGSMEAPSSGLPPGEHLERAEQARLGPGGAPRRRRGDRGVPVDPGRGPDDDGRDGDDRRDRPGIVHRSPGAARYRLRCRTGLPLDELSMGMSSDFETAIEEGATLVRVGSALFEGVGP